MTRSSERERRRWYLERFLDRTGSGTVGDEASPGGPGTEFRVEAAGDAVGARVVELFHPFADPAVRDSVRAFRSAVVEAAEEEWSREPDRPDVEAWVEFSAHEQTTASRNRQELARRLCQVVESELPDPEGFARIVAGRGQEEASFPLVAPAVTVARLPTYSDTSWYAVSGGGGAGLDVDRVGEIIARASPEEERELDDAGERWLVVVLESYRYPSVGAIPDEVTTERYDSAFDRVWLYDPVTDEVRELNG